MILKSLYLANFRNYEEAFFEFSPRFNLIYGDNAQGKTNVLEAIHLIINGKSFRTSDTLDLIQKGKTDCFLEAVFLLHGIEQKIQIHLNPLGKKIFINQSAHRGFISLLGILIGVTMTPDDVVFIKGAPPGRRHFLDSQLVQLDPLYVHHFLRYLKAMRQRNQLLKQKSFETIEIWENEMAISGAYLIHERAKAIKELQHYCGEIHPLLSGHKEKLEIHYRTLSVEEELRAKESYLIQKFKQARQRESELGYSLYGPHRDDLNIKIGDHESKQFASEGQQRSSILSLKLAEWERLKARSQEVPLLLIDDFGLGLDLFRKKQLYEYISRCQQVFMTTNHQDNLPSTYPKQCFEIQNGALLSKT